MGGWAGGCVGSNIYVNMCNICARACDANDVDVVSVDGVRCAFAEGSRLRVEIVGTVCVWARCVFSVSSHTHASAQECVCVYVRHTASSAAADSAGKIHRVRVYKYRSSYEPSVKCEHRDSVTNFGANSLPPCFFFAAGPYRTAFGAAEHSQHII